MKKILTAIAALLISLQALEISAASHQPIANGAKDSTTYYISAPRFVRPLIERWISEYRKEVPGANFAIAKTPVAKNGSVLSVRLSRTASEKGTGLRTAYFGQYAILPFTTQDSEAARLLAGQQLNAKKLKALYFENEEADEEGGKKSKFDKITVYSGSGRESVSREFASFYGQEPNNFRGKRIVGDDLFLNTALSKDPQGVSFNALANLYDLTTRKVKKGLRILNLDYSKEEKSALADSDMDTLLDILETGKDSRIPVERIGFAYQEGSAEATLFLAWILTKGQQYNHEYGIMRLDAKLLAEQAKELPTRLTAQK